MKETNIYQCGENLPAGEIVPKHYEAFFDPWLLWAALGLLVFFLLVAGWAP